MINIIKNYIYTFKMSKNDKYINNKIAYTSKTAKIVI